MHPINESFDYLAPLPFLPVVSILGGGRRAVLILSRNTLGLIVRGVGRATTENPRITTPANRMVAPRPVTKPIR